MRRGGRHVLAPREPDPSEGARLEARKAAVRRITRAREGATMAVQDGWMQQGTTWLHPEIPFYVVEDDVPELVNAGGKSGVEYHVVRAGGDATAGFPLATFSTLEEALEEAEHRARGVDTE